MKTGNRVTAFMRLGIGGSLLWMVAYVWVTGCESDSGIAGPEGLDDDWPEKLLVSEPAVQNQPMSAEEASGSGLEDVGLSYVSILPGSFPEADRAEIGNLRTGQNLSAGMKDGGLDPVGIPAEAGDTLKIRVFQGPTLLAVFDREVPKKNPPKLVRTDPPDRKVKVPLNSDVEVIFSEPIKPSSLTSRSFRVEETGKPISGTIRISGLATAATFSPSSFLRYDAEYAVVLEANITDSSGDPLGRRVVTTFSTVSPSDEPPGVIVMEFSTGEVGYRPWIVIQRPVPGAIAAGTFCPTDKPQTAPALSPDGSAIAYSEYVLGNDGETVAESEVWICRGLLSRLNVTNHPGIDGPRPTWSPDGSHLAFQSNRDDPENDEIYSVRNDGTELRRLTFHGARDKNPAWSPDGSHIAFVSDRDGDLEIFVMGSDGSDPVPLTDHPASDDWPAWSPDGTRIAFSSERDGVPKIYVMNADGSDVHLLSKTSWVFGTTPTWSPDGAWIAYRSPTGVRIIRADGSVPFSMLGPFFEYGTYPSWGVDPPWPYY